MEQRWYEGDEWDRGRHGAPESEPRYAEPAGGRGAIGPRSGAPMPPLPEDPVIGTHGDPGEARRSVEAIDVGSLRRPPLGPPADTDPSDYTGSGFATSDYGRSGYSAPDYGSADYVPQSVGGGFSSAGSGSYTAATAARPADFPPPSSPLGAPSSLGAPGPPAPGAVNGPTGPVSTIPPNPPSVYQTRRPTLALAVAVLVVLFEIPPLRLLISATIADPIQVTGTVAGTFLVAGLPAFAAGLYGLLTGAAAVGGSGWRAWVRPPLAYLPVGVVLFLCAAVAAA